MGRKTFTVKGSAHNFEGDAQVFVYDAENPAQVAHITEENLKIDPETGDLTITAREEPPPGKRFVLGIQE